MPTILMERGWRLFFYANEQNEPIHIHCQKGGMECKYWIDLARRDILEAYRYNMTPRETKAIRGIILRHLDLIETEWNTFQEQRQ